MIKELFEEFTFPSGVTAQNRIVMAPITSQSSMYDGRVTSELINFYRRRAKNTGTIIIESTFVQDNGRAFPGALGIDDDNKISGLRKLAQAIQSEGAKAIIQIFHAGRMAPAALNQGQQPVAPSAISALREGVDVPRELSSAEIEQLIDDFGEATRRAIEAGFDGVEVHGANTFMIQQFYSPHSNRRDDDWGGSRDKRTHFPLAVVRRVKEVIKDHQSDPFIVGYRFSPEEIEEPGIRFEDTMYLLNLLAKEAMDYFHISLANYQGSSIVDQVDTTALIDKYQASQSEQLAQIPLMAVGNIVQHEDAQNALDIGYDLVAIGKAYIATPDWATATFNQSRTSNRVDPDQFEDLKIPETLWDVIGFMMDK